MNEKEALRKEILDGIPELIPKYPPLKPGGDLSIKDMYPNLTDDELNYVFKKYKGTMRLQ